MPMRPLVCAMASAAVFLLSAPAYSADTSEVSKLLLRATLDVDALKTSSGRSALASAAKAYCGELERDYPRNSPAEDQWLSAETRGSSERAMRAINSPEMGRRMAARFIEDCAALSQAVLAAPDSARPSAALAYTFVRYMGDAEFFAAKNGIDTEQYAFGTALRSTVEALLFSSLTARKP